MVIFADSTGIVIKRTLGDENHIRIGLFEVALWANYTRKTLRFVEKPYCEFDINDCKDLLEELGNFERSLES